MVRALTAPPQPPNAVKLNAEQAELLARKGFSSDLEDRLRGGLVQVLRRGVVANKDLLLENRIQGITLRNLATGTERVHFDLFDHVGNPGEERDLFEAEVRGWGASTRRSAGCWSTCCSRTRRPTCCTTAARR